MLFSAAPVILNAIQQEQVLLRTISGDREIVARRRIRDSDSSRLLPREIDDARI